MYVKVVIILIKYCLACYILEKEGKRRNQGGRVPCCKECWPKNVGREVVDLMWARTEYD